MSFISWCLAHLNYYTICLLMLLESTVIPIPSELVVPPAAYRAASDAGGLNVFLVVLVATLGADIGASINYLAGRYLGRPAIYAFANSTLGRLCLLTEEKVRKSEHYFTDHGATATLIGRLVPGIRHLISIPAGMARMTYGRFLLYTTLGAGLWHIILAVLGYTLASVVPEEELESTVSSYSHEIGYAMLALFTAFVAYLIIKKRFEKKRKEHSHNRPKQQER